MTWFKVDDGLHSHRKVKSMHRRDRMPAIGLWCLAGSWSADNLTDGHIPTYMLEELGGTTRQAQVLCAAGLWFQVDDGFQFHGWSDVGRQPTRAEVEANRESERKRKAQWRSRQEVSHRDNTVSPTGTDAGVPPSVPPSVRTPRPDPTRPSTNGSVVSHSPAVPREERTDQKRHDKQPDLAEVARALGSDEVWAERVCEDVLSRVGNVGRPTNYVLEAVAREPLRYQPTPTPPGLDDMCRHGRGPGCPHCARGDE